MKLYLMQHALAYPSSEDPERPLTPEGVQQAKATAEGIKQLGIQFDLIIASTKRRAQQTAALVAEGLRYPYSDILSTEALLPDASLDNIKGIIKSEEAHHILLVGHLPHLEKLAEDLLHGGQLVFANCGLSCLEITEGETARLLFHLQPEQLQR